MKQLVLSFCLLVSTLLGSAQFIALHNEVNTVLGSSVNPTEIISAHWDVINVSGGTRDIRCRREIVQNVTGAEHQFCWGEICGPWATINEVSTEIVNLADGDTSFSFYCKYRHNGNPGQSIVRFCWFDAAQPANQLCYDVNFCVDQACILGVEERLSNVVFEVLGNPVSSLSAINYRFAAPPSLASFTIFNSNGQLIQQRGITSAQGSIIIDAQEFADGVYTCKLTEEGRTVGIQRIVVSK